LSARRSPLAAGRWPPASPKRAVIETREGGLAGTSIREFTLKFCRKDILPERVR
jgi:hypothetical protein